MHKIFVVGVVCGEKKSLPCTSSNTTSVALLTLQTQQIQRHASIHTDKELDSGFYMYDIVTLY